MSQLLLISSLFLFQGNNDLRVQERLRVDYVMLDVVAFDRKGNPVTDLTIDDFEIKEDRNKVEVTFFDTLDFQNSATPDVSQIPQEYQEAVKRSSTRQIVLAIDLENVKEVETRKVFSQLNQFVDQLDPSVDFRINIYSLERGSISKGFVKDVAATREALQQLEQRHLQGLERERDPGGGGDLLLGDTPGQSVARTFGSRPGRSMGASMLDDEFRFPHLEKAFSQCKFLYQSDTSGLNNCINQTLNDFMDQHRFRAEQVVGQLEILTYAFEETEGLKLMLFVSPGFALHSMAAAFEMANIYKGNTRPGIPDPMGSSIDIDNDFKRVLHACIKNRVIFHTFDIFNGGATLEREIGVANGGDLPAGAIRRAYRNYSTDISSGLRELAEESGGSYFQAPQLQGVMNKVLERDTYFYQLGYDSPQGKPGKYRKIKIKCKRKGVKLKYRTGYFGA